MNTLENNSEIKTSAKIPNVQQVPKESTTIIPDDEVIYLSESNCSNNCSLKAKTTTRSKKQKKRKLPLQSSEKDRNSRTFDLIYQNSEKIKLPNSTWGYHKNDKDNDIMVFSKVRWFSTNACTLPLYERQVRIIYTWYFSIDDIKFVSFFSLSNERWYSTRVAS